MVDTGSVQASPYFGAFILETLTLGMYGESKNAIREYIQNGFDSIQRAIRDGQIAAGKGQITVSFQEDMDGINIRDNGAGLAVGIAHQTLTSVGASRKDYRNDAGFRGIGRLAAIAFCDTVAFETKAKDEDRSTKVTFRAREMRSLMSPANGNTLTAEELLRRCVDVMISEADPSKPSFFEVTLRGFTQAPEECENPDEMIKFLSQVAPVPYAPDFAFAAEVKGFAEKGGISIEEVNVVVEAPEREPTPVFKPFASDYEVAGSPERVELSGLESFFADDGSWWAWVGYKPAPGSYVSSEVRGLRVRAKNIQIDGTDVVGQIFRKRAKSTARFQDWFVGEVFVDIAAVVPNARRDGFEETKKWLELQDEIAEKVCQTLGREAQRISDKAQITLARLTEKSGSLNETFAKLKRNNFRDKDKVLLLSADITKIHGQVENASRNADSRTLAALRHLGSQLVDLKTEAVLNIVDQVDVDLVEIELELRETILKEIMTVFEAELPTPCLSAVRNVLRDIYGYAS